MKKKLIGLLVAFILVWLCIMFVPMIQAQEEEIINLEITTNICTKNTTDNELSTIIPIDIHKISEYIKMLKYPTKQPSPHLEYTEDDIFVLQCIIYQEGGGGEHVSDECLLDHGSIFMNRVDDARFPDTIREVAEQRGQYGRFYWDGVHLPNRGNSELELMAIERCREIAIRILEGERTAPLNVIWDAEFIQGEIWREYDNCYMCYG